MSFCLYTLVPISPSSALAGLVAEVCPVQQYFAGILSSKSLRFRFFFFIILSFGPKNLFFNFFFIIFYLDPEMLIFFFFAFPCSFVYRTDMIVLFLLHTAVVH